LSNEFYDAGDDVSGLIPSTNRENQDRTAISQDQGQEPGNRKGQRGLKSFSSREL
jgi:hypothetical protein